MWICIRTPLAPYAYIHILYVVYAYVYDLRVQELLVCLSVNLEVIGVLYIPYYTIYPWLYIY